jgi:hypothetical protein
VTGDVESRESSVPHPVRGAYRRLWRARARGARRRSVRLRIDTKAPEPAVASGQSTFDGTFIRVLYRFGRFRSRSQASDLGIPRQGRATRPSNRNEVGGLPTCFLERGGRFRFLKPPAAARWTTWPVASRPQRIERKPATNRSGRLGYQAYRVSSVGTGCAL